MKMEVSFLSLILGKFDKNVKKKKKRRLKTKAGIFIQSIPLIF